MESMHATAESDHVTDLRGFLDAAPSPFHAVAEAARRLDAAGFTELDETHRWDSVAGRRYLRRGGTLVAWAAPPRTDGPPRFAVVGAHTDSPNLRLKPAPDVGGHGYRQLGVEVYGGALLNSWLDRDLGVSGRVVVATDDGPTEVLVRDDDIGLRIPQLAIHLDREVVSGGLTLNPQTHLRPVWGLEATSPDDFLVALGERRGFDGAAVLAHDLMTHDVTPARVQGAGGELLASGRIDNLVSCHAALTALCAAADPDPTAAIPLVVLFDHEEIGSTSASGAAGSILPTIVDRIVAGLGADAEDKAAGLAGSMCVSTDGAHATHPNYAERHDPGHHIRIDGGPVIKHNASVRYATDAHTAAAFAAACERAGVPVQRFVMRSDLACGSTIGPVTAARMGIGTVDVGVAQLAMHSARETCGAADPGRLTTALGAFFRAPIGG